MKRAEQTVKRNQQEGREKNMEEMLWYLTLTRDRRIHHSSKRRYGSRAGQHAGSRAGNRSRKLQGSTLDSLQAGCL